MADVAYSLSEKQITVLAHSSGLKRGDDQTGPMCTQLKKPTTDAHGSGFLCPVFGRVARRTGVSRFLGLRHSALRPSLR
jgi:hypothetical protein